MKSFEFTKRLQALPHSVLPEEKLQNSMKFRSFQQKFRLNFQILQNFPSINPKVKFLERKIIQIIKEIQAMFNQPENVLPDENYGLLEIKTIVLPDEFSKNWL